MKEAKRPNRLFDQVADQLRKHVGTETKPGDRLPSISTLAASLRVSPTTLRTAQALLIKEGLLTARHGSGVYVTNRVHQRVIGIVSEMDLLHPRATPFISEVARLLRKSFDERGFRTELYIGTIAPWEVPAVPTCPRFFEDLAVGRLNAVAVVNAPRTEPWVTLAKEALVPVVSIVEDVHVASEEEVVVQGVRQLGKQGVRHCAMLGWGGEPLRRWFRDTVRENGLGTRDGWIRTDFHPWLTAAGWEAFREVWLGGVDKPDGLLVCDDGLFIEAMAAIEELRIRVPDQIQVVTHANKGSGVRYPFPVTLLQNDPALVAGILETKLVDLMNGKPRGEPIGHTLEIVEQGAKALATFPGRVGSPLPTTERRCVR